MVYLERPPREQRAECKRGGGTAARVNLRRRGTCFKSAEYSFSFKLVAKK